MSRRRWQREAGGGHTDGEALQVLREARGPDGTALKDSVPQPRCELAPRGRLRAPLMQTRRKTGPLEENQGIKFKKQENQGTWSSDVFPREQPTMADESDGKLACGSCSRMSLPIVIATGQGHRGQRAIRMRIPSCFLPSPS
ncbi:hypothetical protein HJG60_011786 [Phyllostomus discolor]|uniref:Uncharacterized protein n=1 Tax=Phyllostomus discolor TaxID=89673 RepID=A0A834DVX7_9CHIR|nr:hypothetical protein HJG60_011786 [Phyllostomus discolor]